MKNAPLTDTNHQSLSERSEDIERLEQFAELSSDWFWEQDSELRFTKISGSNTNLINKEQGIFIGRRRWEIPIAPNSLKAMKQHKQCCEQHKPFFDFQYEIIDHNGKAQRFSITGTPIFDPNGEFIGYHGLGRNITVLHEAKKELKDSQQKLSQIILGNPIASFVIDKNHTITHWNQACERLTGITAKDVIGTKESWRGFYDKPRPVMANLLLSGALDDEIKKHYGHKFHHSSLIPGAYEAEDYFPKMHEGRWLYFTAAPLRDEYGKIIGAIETLQDITRQKKQEERIIHQAHFDNLTGLPNRFLAMDRLALMLEEAKRNQKQLAVLFIDLDDFKKVNDTLGHEVGDQLLVQASERLRETIRSYDTVGRLGGDEFIILLNNLKSADDAKPVAEKLLKRFRSAFQLGGREVLLTTSVGIALYPDDGTDPAELLRNADSAMYYSKNEGRNTYHFFKEEMNQGIKRRLLIEEQLHNAVARGEFEVYYQPIIDLQNSNIKGAEALARWQNSTLGSISPDEFIPIAEQTGLIIPLGYYVLREAIKTVALWRREFSEPFHISVNLSPLQFRDPKLIQRIGHELNRCKVNGSALILEITEGVLLGNQQYIHNAFEQLKQLDVLISMDDFGTGYSSLSYLQKYPFDTLKIDRSFLNSFANDSSAPALIDATIAMAHALGLKVVAEGIETAEQQQYLQKKRCNFGQGYLFSRPIPKEEFQKLLDIEICS